MGATPLTGRDAVISSPRSSRMLLMTVDEIVVPEVTGIPAVGENTPLPFLGITSYPSEVL
jgi:hypothetical protein